MSFFGFKWVSKSVVSLQNNLIQTLQMLLIPISDIRPLRGHDQIPHEVENSIFNKNGLWATCLAASLKTDTEHTGSDSLSLINLQTEQLLLQETLISTTKVRHKIVSIFNMWNWDIVLCCCEEKSLHFCTRRVFPFVYFFKGLYYRFRVVQDGSLMVGIEDKRTKMINGWHTYS